MENSEIASSYQMAESTEASNDNQMIFVKGLTALAPFEFEFCISSFQIKILNLACKFNK
jgi:hypothetical protein